MEKLDIYMDAERKLYLRDKKGTTYNFWPLGMGIPVQFVLETEDERMKREQDRKEWEKLQYESDAENRRVIEMQKPWWKKILD